MCCCVSKAEQCTLRCGVVNWGILAASSLQPIRELVDSQTHYEHDDLPSSGATCAPNCADAGEGLRGNG